jgi:hypothetical protein
VRRAQARLVDPGWRANSDKTLLVVRHGRHPEMEISEALKRPVNVGVNLHGVLLTHVPPPKLNLDSHTRYCGFESRAQHSRHLVFLISTRAWWIARRVALHSNA